MDIKPIRTEQDYEAALARVDELMDAELGTPEGEELDVLVDLVEAYESRHVPMGYPSAVEAMEFRRDQEAEPSPERYRQELMPSPETNGDPVHRHAWQPGPGSERTG